MARIVVDNTSPAARQRQLEARVQVAFAKAASGVLIFLAGKQTEDGLIETMQEFIAVHETARTESTDPKGIAIRVPKLDRRKDGEDEHINAILRGSLRMVAAMLEVNANVPLENRGGKEVMAGEKRAYKKALKEIADGIALMQARIDQAAS